MRLSLVLFCLGEVCLAAGVFLAVGLASVLIGLGLQMTTWALLRTHEEGTP